MVSAVEMPSKAGARPVEEASSQPALENEKPPDPRDPAALPSEYQGATSIESPGKAARIAIECTAVDDASSGDVSYMPRTSSARM